MIRSLATGLANTVCSKESDIGRHSLVCSRLGDSLDEATRSPPNPRKPTALPGAAGIGAAKAVIASGGCDGARIRAADSLARVGSQSVTKAAALFFFPLPVASAANHRPSQEDPRLLPMPGPIPQSGITDTPARCAFRSSACCCRTISVAGRFSSEVEGEQVEDSIRIISGYSDVICSAS